MLNKFLKDPNYLLRIFINNTIIFAVLCSLLFIFDVNILHFDFSLSSLILVPIALVLGLVSATAFHNCSHGNIKPRFLNTIVGELTANLSLEDLRCFTVGHMLHHKHTDDPELDPHPPGNLSFFQFMKNSRNNTIEVITKNYYNAHGETEVTRRNVKQQIVIFHILAILKILFWFKVFGLSGFVLFYLPSYLSYFFGFGHLNYISHQPNEDGINEVSNNMDTPFFNIMNFITSGGYHHKNHHKYPGLYNPSKVENKKIARPSIVSFMEV